MSARSPSLFLRGNRHLGRPTIPPARRYVDSGAVALFPVRRRRAGGSRPTPALQVRGVGSLLVSPELFSRRGRPHTREKPVADHKSERSATLALLPRLFPGGSDHECGENTDNRKENEPGAALATRPRFTSRETWSLGREKRPRARNARTRPRLGSAACDICPVVLFHSGGSQISGGDMIERPSHPGSPTFVFAIPVSTYRAEKKPRMAEKSDERPR